MPAAIKAGAQIKSRFTHALGRIARPTFSIDDDSRRCPLSSSQRLSVTIRSRTPTSEMKYGEPDGGRGETRELMLERPDLAARAKTANPPDERGQTCLNFDIG